jgi:hypothetical protein
MLQNLPTFLKKYNFVQLLILSFPIVIINVKHISEVIMIILAIFGIYYAIKEKTLPFFNSQLKIYSIITIGNANINNWTKLYFFKNVGKFCNIKH